MATDMDLDHNSRSPSPPLPPPTPSAPGPRATALQKLYNDAISHILKTCSYTNFSSCFPTPSSTVPSSIKVLHEQFTTKLGTSMHNEFTSILEERAVIPSLNELDRLIEDAKRRKAQSDPSDAPAPPHTLPAKQLYISHLAPTLGRYEQDMKSRQEALAEENQELVGRVLQQRRDIAKLMEGLEGVVRDLNGSVEALGGEQGVDVEGLREGNREVDEGMRE